MSITKVFAPAKVNLTLHVTGQRRDGYHCWTALWSSPMWAIGSR